LIMICFPLHQKFVDDFVPFLVILLVLQMHGMLQLGMNFPLLDNMKNTCLKCNNKS
jgi:hypothetical protein